MLESKSKLETKVQQTKNEIDKNLNQMQHSRFIQQKSNTIANKTHARALGEIFNVLCVSALHSSEKKAEQSDTTSNESLTSNDNVEATASAEGETKSTKVPSVLDVALAQPHMLQPKVLADSMSQVLQSLVEQQKHHFAKLRGGESAASKADVTVESVDAEGAAVEATTEEEAPLPPLLINRDQFVAEVLHHMATGALPPIGYILSQPERENKPVRQTNAAKLMRSEDLAALKCKEKPDLAAKKTTDSLVKGRYKLRMTGQEKVEDSLLSCKSICSVSCFCDVF